MLLTAAVPAIATPKVESNNDVKVAEVDSPIEETLLIAQESPSDTEEDVLRITVTGTRTPRAVNDLPATVTVFDLEDI